MSKAELARAIGRNDAVVRPFFTAQSNPELRTIAAMAEALNADIRIVPRRKTAHRLSTPGERWRTWQEDDVPARGEEQSRDVLGRRPMGSNARRHGRLPRGTTRRPESRSSPQQLRERGLTQPATVGSRVRRELLSAPRPQLLRARRTRRRRHRFRTSPALLRV